jgi:ATP phosphoribosyltransferase
MADTALPAVRRERLRIAIQKNGRLGEPARALLSACGLAWREDPDRLFCHADNAPVDLLLVRDDDIPRLLVEGHCEWGIVGRNVLGEMLAGLREEGGEANVRESRALGFGGCRLALAVPEAMAWRGPASLAGQRIATSHPALLRAWLAERGVDASVVKLSGSVEIAPRLGQADAVCDLVSSGATLAANRLRPVQDLLASEAVLAEAAGALDPGRAEVAATLLRRIDSVLRARDRRLLVFRARRDALPGLMSLLPDAESPTVYPTDDGESVSLQALWRGHVPWQQLEALERAGARGLMVLPVERMLA